MKPCNQCGSVCPDDAVFCPNCGASLTMFNQNGVPTSPVPEQPVVTAAPAAPTEPHQPIATVPVQAPPAPVPPASDSSPYVPPTASSSPQQSPAPPSPPQQPSYGQPVYGHPYPQQTPHTPQQPPSPYPQPPYGQSPYYPPYGQKRNSPTVLGIVGIVFAILLPLVTYCCSIPGLVMANQDVRRGWPSQNARILNIVALSLAVVNSFIGILWRL